MQTAPPVSGAAISIIGAHAGTDRRWPPPTRISERSVRSISMVVCPFFLAPASVRRAFASREALAASTNATQVSPGPQGMRNVTFT